MDGPGFDPEPTNGHAPGPLDDFDSSFFPAPSPYYLRYTSRNLALPPSELIADVPGEPVPFPASELEPPDIDAIVRQGSYSVFGETWPVQEALPTLEDMGVRQLFDSSQDRKLSLQTLLRALLVTYTQLLSALLAPPPSLARSTLGEPSAPPPNDSARLTDHIRLIAINMHHLVNELRPVQARETLKSMMRYQIDERRAKTALIKARCAEIERTLATVHRDVTETSTSFQVPPASPGDGPGTSKDNGDDVNGTTFVPPGSSETPSIPPTSSGSQVP
ncbi:hypothetical protein JCM10212_000168 [Sporobolomyces blumeae]